MLQAKQLSGHQGNMTNTQNKQPAQQETHIKDLIFLCTQVFEYEIKYN